jgi:hypothetical protein
VVPSILRNILSFWHKFYIDVRLGDFIFKYYNNSLGLNARVANFIVNHDASCTFCTLSGINPVPWETFDHLFYWCNYSTRLIDNIIARLFSNKFLSEMERKKFFLFGIYTVAGTDCWTEFSGLCSAVLTSIIWDCKLSKTCKTFAIVERDFICKILAAQNMSNAVIISRISFEASLGTNLAWARV